MAVLKIRVWSRGEIFSKKINKKWRAHKAPPPPIITKVKQLKITISVQTYSELPFNISTMDVYEKILAPKNSSSKANKFPRTCDF